MDKDQFALLLTVARIFRARLEELACAYYEDDMAALNEALEPFDAQSAEPVNEAAGEIPAEVGIALARSARS